MSSRSNSYRPENESDRLSDRGRLYSDYVTGNAIETGIMTEIESIVLRGTGTAIEIITVVGVAVEVLDAVPETVEGLIVRKDCHVIAGVIIVLVLIVNRVLRLTLSLPSRLLFPITRLM